MEGDTLTLDPATITLFSSAACGFDTTFVTPSGFNCNNIGDNTVTLSVRDINGTTGTCTAQVTVFSALWNQVGSTINGEASGDSFGSSVAFSDDGKRMAVGAFGNDGAGNNAGHVRVFDESGGVWTQVGADIDAEAATNSACLLYTSDAADE